MKRLFIIGASILQLPAIKRAKELGYTVAVADYNPHAVGIPFADTYYNVSTIDEQGICDAARDFGADGIMTLATDMPMRSVAYTCSQLGLTGISYDTAIKATDKGEMIRVFEAAGVEHPWFHILSHKDDWETIRDAVSYPCITKPVDSSGSRGIVLVHNETELQKAIGYSSDNSRGGGVIVEEYMQGPEVSVEVIVYQGVPHILQITDKITTGAPRFVEMGHTQPSRLPCDTQEKIKDLTRRAVKAVGIENGPAHVEIMVTESGPKMVELGARMGGDFITTDLVPLSTGIDMLAATILSACGEPVDLQPKHKKASVIRYLETERHGVLCGTEGLNEAMAIPGIIRVDMMKAEGETAGPITNSLDRVGYIIAQADTVAEAESLCEKGKKTVKVLTR